MKRVLLVFLAALLLCGCSQEQKETLPSFAPAEETAAAETAMPTETEETVPEADFSFSDLQYTEFHFNSGVGGWGTVLVIHPDGSFTGEYYDSNMGIREAEYPNGSVDLSNFTGQLGQPQWVNEYTCSLKIESIQYEVAPGTVEIREGIRYSYGTAYGLAGTEELLLYLPGALISELPASYLPWAFLYEYEGPDLPRYGIYNPDQEQGFYGINIIANIWEQVQTAEETTAAMNAYLETHYTQADMNLHAQEKYRIWDNILNQLWQVLKKVLPEEEMRQLANEELQWIKEKEQAALDAAAEYEGGSIYPSVYYITLADLTKERVYELLERLPNSD